LIKSINNKINEDCVDNLSFESEESGKFKMLKKKTKRSQNTLSKNLPKCDICLELAEYSESQLIECNLCCVLVHKKCLSEFTQETPNQERIGRETSSKMFNWLCSRCEESKILKQDFNNMRCLICSESNGYLMKINGQQIHVRCLRLIPELFEVFPNIAKIDPETKFENVIRKWRTKNKCKICTDRSESKMVIKCSNTKCKFYSHIQCAIKTEMILPLDFTYDYLGFTKEEKYTKPLPFYCHNHSRNMVKDYKIYLSQVCTAMSVSEGNRHKESICSAKGSTCEENSIRVEKIEQVSQFQVFHQNPQNQENQEIKENKLNQTNITSDSKVSTHFCFDNIKYEENPFFNFKYLEELNPGVSQVKIPEKPQYQMEESILFPGLNVCNPYFPPENCFNNEYNILNIENNNNHFTFNFEMNEETINNTGECFEVFSKILFFH
jgi:hypothetical protein